VKIALIGCGRVARHYQFILDSGVAPGIDVVGVCDIDERKRSEFADHFSAYGSDALEACLAHARPDLVVIATPSGLHAEHTREALTLGYHVLVEKPAAMLPSEIIANDVLARERGLMYAVAFQNRLNSAVQLLKSAVDDNRFGQVTSLSVRLRWSREQSYYNDGWHGTWKMDGGVINQQAIHHIDVLQWLFGPVSDVSATVTKRLNSLEAEDTLVAIFKTAEGALGTIEATTAARPRDFEASLTVTAEGGVARVGGIALNKVEEFSFVSARDEDDALARASSHEVPSGYGLSHGGVLVAIADALASGSVDAPINAIDSLHTCELIHAMYRSDEDRSWVTVGAGTTSQRLGR
jgi:predicted dehydrogenase